MRGCFFVFIRLQMPWAFDTSKNKKIHHYRDGLSALSDLGRVFLGLFFAKK